MSNPSPLEVPPTVREKRELELHPDVVAHLRAATKRMWLVPLTWFGIALPIAGAAVWVAALVLNSTKTDFEKQVDKRIDDRWKEKAADVDFVRTTLLSQLTDAIGKVHSSLSIAERASARAENSASEAERTASAYNKAANPAQLKEIQQAALDLGSKIREGSSLVPVGTIVAYAGVLGAGYPAPDGWLLCDGSPLPPDARFDRLRNVLASGPNGWLTSSNVPDLRGMFLRGANGSRNDEWADPDNTRPVGKPQRFSTAAPIKGVGNQSDFNQRAKHIIVQRTERVGRELSGGISGTEELNKVETYPALADEETRPNNVAVNWIIKY